MTPPTAFTGWSRPRVGLHARNDFVWTETDYKIFRQAKIETLKTMSHTGLEEYKRVRREFPQMEFIVRLFDDRFGGDEHRGYHPSPQDFAARMVPVIKQLRPYAVKFEIHNEPNHLHRYEGWGQEDHLAQDFREWYRQVLRILKGQCSWASFGFPGLAVPHNDIRWLEICEDVIKKSDWLGCHTYWQRGNIFHEDWGLRFIQYHERFPDKVIEITEFGNSNRQSDIPLTNEEMADQYARYYKKLFEYSYIGSASCFIATSQDPKWTKEFAWADSSQDRLFPVVYAVGKMARPPLKRVEKPYVVEWISDTIPSRMTVDERVTVTVKLKNGGSKTWPVGGPNPVRLGYHWYDLAGEEVLVRESVRTKLPKDILPGEEVTLSAAQVVAPAQAGTYNLVWDLVEEGVTWFSAHESPTLKRRINVRPAVVPRPAYQVAWLQHSLPATMTADEEMTLTFRLKNTGSKTWSAAGNNPVRLGYHWYTSDGQEVLVREDFRATLPHDLPPGREVTLTTVRVVAPMDAGTFTLLWDLVEEGITWFSNAGAQALERTVQVQPAVVPKPAYSVSWLADTIPVTMVADQVITLAFRLRNEGTRTWLADGNNPVRLGYHWYTPDGRDVPVREDFRTALPRDIAPDQEVGLVNVQVVAPDQPGQYTLLWDLVEEGITWFSNAGSRALERVVYVQAVAEAPYLVEWLRYPSLPVALSPGQTFKGTFRLRNAGNRTWRADGTNPVHLGYHWLTPDGSLAGGWEDFRASLPNDVSPGRQVTLRQVSFVAPQNPGNYLLRWDLVEEGVAWFARRGSPPLLLSVKVAEEVVEEVVAEEVVEEPVVVAPAWRASASHNATEANKALDGDRASFWSSVQPQAPGMWFQVDLGKARIIDGIAVRSPGRGYPVGYSVRVSVDGQNWVSVGQLEQNWRDVVVQFAPCQVRFVHIDQTGTTAWRAPWLVAEVLVHEGVAWRAEANLNKEAAGKAFDNRLDTLWSTVNPQRPPMHYTLDLGRVEKVSGLALVNPPDKFPQGYIVRVSTDGQRWLEVTRNDSNWVPVNIEFGPVQARYISIEGTATNPWHAWSISAIHVQREWTNWISATGSRATARAGSSAPSLAR